MESILNKKYLNSIMIIFGAFLVPCFLEQIINLGSYKQLIIGSIVNTSLLFYKGNKKVLVSMLPSSASICSGLLFTGLTKYSILLIPFISFGNYLIMSINKNTLIDYIKSIVLKVGVIYFGFLLMSNLFNYPDKVRTVLSTSMGYYQLITASIGCLIYFIAKKKGE